MLFQQLVTSIVVSNFGNYSCLSTVYYCLPWSASTRGQVDLLLKWCNLLAIIHHLITKFISVFLCVQFEDLNLLVFGKIIKRTGQYLPNIEYHIAESTSGQDKVNLEFWLVTLASKMGPSFPLGISHLSSVRKSSVYGHITNPILTTLVPACKESSVNSPELVDFAIGLVNSVFKLPDG